MKNRLSQNNMAAIACGAMLVWATSADAAVLANYTFQSSTGATTDVDVNSVATAFAAGPGFTSTGYESGGADFGSSMTRWVGANDTDTSANAVPQNNYFEFTITPQSGYELDLTSLALEFGTSFTGGYTRALFIRSSIDSYAANVGSFSLANTPTAQTYGTYSANLSGASFQNLLTTTTFRIYIYENGANLAASHFRLDDIVLNGDSVAVVPEPSTTGLVALALIGIVLRRSRRRGI